LTIGGHLRQSSATTPPSCSSPQLDVRRDGHACVRHRPAHVQPAHRRHRRLALRDAPDAAPLRPGPPPREPTDAALHALALDDDPVPQAAVDRERPSSSEWSPPGHAHKVRRDISAGGVRRRPLARTAFRGPSATANR
jgi:hypothetical protein